MECSPCGKKFTGIESYEQHLESEKHKKKMLNVNNSSVHSATIASSNSKCDEILKCHICDLSFNSLESFKYHTETREHASKIINSNSAINSHEINATNYKVEPTDEQSILPGLNENKLSYDSCQVCSKIFSGPEPFKQHIESQAHKKKVALLQNQTYAGENLILKCDACNKSFSGQIPYAQHMSSEIHKKKLQNIQNMEKYLSNSQNGGNEMEEKEDESKLWFCGICNKQCSGMIPYEQHMSGNIHFKNARRVQLESNFAKISNSMTTMQKHSFNESEISEKSENITQLVNLNYQVDNYKSQNDFVNSNGGMKSPIQVNNSNEGKLSEKFENTSQIMNGTYKKGNGISQNDFVFLEKYNELKAISTDELGELIKIIPPDEEIDFGEIEKPKDSANENIDAFSEYLSQDQSNESGFDDDLKETEAEKNSEVYQTCKFCNISLFDKDSAAEHFESKEHIEKRWGLII